MFKLAIDLLVLGTGAFFLFAGGWIPGLILMVLGFGMLNGSRHGDVWISFSLRPPARADEDAEGGGNGDGDGGGGD